MEVKENLFVKNYIVCKGNAYQAALQAGYAKNTSKYAFEWLTETLSNSTNKRHLPYKPYLREAIDKQIEQIESDLIASGEEVMQYLTSVMRKSATSKMVVVEGTGEGTSKARLIEKPPDEKEALRAAGELAKILGLSNNVNISGQVGVVIVDDIENS